MSRRPIIPAVAILLAIPTVAADPLLLGTEDLPELPDSVNDVAYDPLYTGPKDHGYVDLVAAWFSYDGAKDEITFNLKVADASPLEAGLSGWFPGCQVVGDLASDDGPKGAMRFYWSQDFDEKRFSLVEFDPDPNSSPVTPVSERARSLEHTFIVELEEPGYFRFVLARSTLLQIADRFHEPRAACVEYYSPHAEGTPIGPAGSPIYTNRDDAESESVYSFAEQRRLNAPDGTLEEPMLASSTTSPTTDETTPADNGSDTAGFGLVAAVVVLAALASWRRR